MEEDEYNDIVTYIQDQKYPQNGNESVKRKLWILLKPFSLKMDVEVKTSRYKN
jgi:hypothetical protein